MVHFGIIKARTLSLYLIDFVRNIFKFMGVAISDVIFFPYFEFLLYFKMILLHPYLFLYVCVHMSVYMCVIL